MRAGLILLLAGLAGCHDPGVGSISADRQAVEKVLHAGSETSGPPRGSRKAPDTNDLSPKVRKGEARP